MTNIKKRFKNTERMMCMRCIGSMISKVIVCICMVLVSSYQVRSLPAVRMLDANQAYFDTNTGLFRDQLDDNAKLCYDAMKYMYNKNHLSINDFGFKKLVCQNQRGGESGFRLSVSDVECRKNGVPTSMGKGKINLMMRKIFEAFLYDNPQYYWINDFEFKVSSVRVHKIRRVDARYVETLSMNVSLKSVYWKGVYPDKFAEFNKSIADYSERCLQGTSSTYDKIKSIHDTLCKDVVYAIDNKSEYEQTAIDIFLPSYAGNLNKQEGVCEAYAKAFKLLCMRANIPCMIAVGYSWWNEGGNHAWNLVRLDDGKWYAVDTTWDDVGNGDCVHDFFLSGSDTVVLGKLFAFTHQMRKLELEDGSFIMFDLLYPKIATQRYVA